METKKQYLIIKMLSRLLKKGYSLNEALKLTMEVNPKVVAKIISYLEQGYLLSEIFKLLRFKRFVYEGIKVGEISNKLNEVFLLIDEEFNNYLKIKASMNKVLLYPSILFILSLVTFEVIRVSLYPVIGLLLSDFGIKQSEILSFIAFNLLKIIGGVTVFLLLTVKLLPKIRNMLNIFKTYQSIHVSDNLIILLSCGNSLNDSLAILEESIDKRIYDLSVIEKAIFSDNFASSLLSPFSKAFLNYLKLGVKANEIVVVLKDFNYIYLDVLFDKLLKITYIIQMFLFSVLSLNIFLLYYLILVPMLNISQSI